MSGAFLEHKRLRCVIVENGSLSLAEAGAGDFDETIVIAQMQGELPEAFSERVTRRLVNFERLRKCAQSAVMLVGTSNDAATVAARRTMLGALARHVRPWGAAAEVVLITSPDAPGEHRAGLLTLAETMLALPSSERVPIKMQFGQPRAA
jgi:hypothetical protein